MKKGASSSPFLPLFSRIDELLSKGRVVLAIDGGAGSGKTTLSALLSERYGCTVFHADDFFLRPEQKTAERLAEAGGNLDRERLLSEVLLPLSHGEAVSYRRYDCHTRTLLPSVTVYPERLTVIEGSYSMHPELDGYYNLSVFLDISPEEQRRRIEKRSSPETAERFFSEWIVLENRYFETYGIKSACDIVISV